MPTNTTEDYLKARDEYTEAFLAGFRDAVERSEDPSQFDSPGEKWAYRVGHNEGRLHA